MRISPVINRCKSNILEVAKDDRIIEQLRKNVNGKLKEVNNVLKEFEQSRISNLVEKYAKSIFNNTETSFPQTDTKFQSHLEFLILSCYQCHYHLCFARKGKMKLFLAEPFFSEKSVEIIMEEWK